jgi:hypothetical protein
MKHKELKDCKVRNSRGSLGKFLDPSFTKNLYKKQTDKDKNTNSETTGTKTIGLNIDKTIFKEECEKIFQDHWSLNNDDAKIQMKFLKP